MDMELIKQFVTPELMIMVPVIYVLGMMLKDSTLIKDERIPLILGIISIVMSTTWVVSSTSMCLESIFIGITQGILVAGTSVYCNQMIKQSKK